MPWSSAISTRIMSPAVGAHGDRHGQAKPPPSGSPPASIRPRSRSARSVQPGDPVAGVAALPRRGWHAGPLAVVDHLHPRVGQARLHLHLAVRGAAVADDVCGPLAHRPGQHRLHVRVQRDRRALDLGLDARRRQRHPRSLQLLVQRRLPVAAHRLAHLAQRLAGHPLHVGDLGGRPLGIDRHQPPGQLGLDGDHRQAVAEQVVQVTGEALALGRHRAQGQLGARLVELVVAHAQVAHEHQQQPDADRAHPVPTGGAAGRRRRSACTPCRTTAAGDDGGQPPNGRDDQAHARRDVGEQEPPAGPVGDPSARSPWPASPSPGRSTASARAPRTTSSPARRRRPRTPRRRRWPDTCSDAEPVLVTASTIGATMNAAQMHMPRTRARPEGPLRVRCDPEPPAPPGPAAGAPGGGAGRSSPHLSHRLAQEPDHQVDARRPSRSPAPSGQPR